MGTDSALGKRPTPKKKHFRSGRLDQSIFNQIKKKIKITNHYRKYFDYNS